MSRKDIFYSGSVVNLPEYQSQRSLAGYRQSILSLPQYTSKRGVTDGGDVEKGPRKLIVDHLWHTYNRLTILKFLNVYIKQMS